MYQVSANSMIYDTSLPACVDHYLGSHDTPTFIAGMKSDHRLAHEYCARLLRFSLKWDGPIERGVLAACVRRDACAEFVGLILG